MAHTAYTPREDAMLASTIMAVKPEALSKRKINMSDWLKILRRFNKVASEDGFLKRETVAAISHRWHTYVKFNLLAGGPGFYDDIEARIRGGEGVVAAASASNNSPSIQPETHAAAAETARLVWRRPDMDPLSEGQPPRTMNDDLRIERAALWALGALVATGRDPASAAIRAWDYGLEFAAAGPPS